MLSCGKLFQVLTIRYAKKCGPCSTAGMWFKYFIRQWWQIPSHFLQWHGNASMFVTLLMIWWHQIDLPKTILITCVFLYTKLRNQSGAKTANKIILVADFSLRFSWLFLYIGLNIPSDAASCSWSGIFDCFYFYCRSVILMILASVSKTSRPKRR